MTEAPHRGHKNDRGRNSNRWIIQKSSENLPKDGPECSADGLCVEDNTERKPHNQILGGGCKTSSPPARQCAGHQHMDRRLQHAQGVGR